MTTFIIADRVKETSTTTGTGTLTLAGAVSSFRTFTSVMSNTNTCYYAIQHLTANEYEIGLGTLATSTTLTRTAVFKSSNANAVVSLSSGTKEVFIVAPAQQVIPYEFALFGDGSDGDVSLSSGTTSLTRDMYYNNLTLTGTAKFATSGYRVFVRGILDISAAGNGCINRDGTNGVNASSATGASAPAAQSASTVGGSGNGGAGGTGSTTTGAQAAAPTNLTPANGGAGGLGAAGGSGTSGAGGGTRAGATVANPVSYRHFTQNLLRGVSIMSGGAGGAGGAGGGGDGTAGAGGGSGGNGGCIVWVSARFVNRSGSTADGAISCVGGNGGNGFTPAAGARGGGGGAGGGGGGYIYFAYGALLGSTATNCFSAGGGTGGNGGNATGAGVGGNGGTGGAGGRIAKIDLGAGTYTEAFGTTGTTGNSASGTTGGTGGAGDTEKVNL